MFLPLVSSHFTLSKIRNRLSTCIYSVFQDFRLCDTLLNNGILPFFTKSILAHPFQGVSLTWEYMIVIIFTAFIGKFGSCTVAAKSLPSIYMCCQVGFPT